MRPVQDQSGVCRGGSLRSGSRIQSPLRLRRAGARDVTVTRAVLGSQARTQRSNDGVHLIKSANTTSPPWENHAPEEKKMVGLIIRPNRVIFLVLSSVGLDGESMIGSSLI